MTVPLPENEVAVGESWSFPHDTSVRQKDGSTKQVKTRQKFTLTEVDKGIATIRVETDVLTPIRDPALEAQLIQHVTDGTVRFDIAAGRVVGQQTDIDKRVVGFQGEASSMHYVTRFSEELMREQPRHRQPRQSDVEVDADGKQAHRECKRRRSQARRPTTRRRSRRNPRRLPRPMRLLPRAEPAQRRRPRSPP